ncbi:MAG: type II toxin-antitoxin system VapC family toxin [Acidobacteriota bacterium]
MTFFDASALVKRYIGEVGSDWVRQRLTLGINSVARLTATEVASALARRTREGSLTPQQRNQIVERLREDFERLHVVELTERVTLRSWGLLARHPLRASDALQLASCLELAEQLSYPVTFAAFDQRLSEAAVSEGLKLAESESVGR